MSEDATVDYMPPIRMQGHPPTVYRLRLSAPICRRPGQRALRAVYRCRRSSIRRAAQQYYSAKGAGFAHRMYRFRVVNYICGQPMHRSGMKPDMQIRLFDRRYANWDLLDVGEAPHISPAACSRLPVSGDICHYRCADFRRAGLPRAAKRRNAWPSNGSRRYRRHYTYVVAQSGICLYKMPLTRRCHTRRSCRPTHIRARFMATLAAYRAARNILKESTR